MKLKIKLITILSLMFVLGCKKDDEGLNTNQDLQAETIISIEDTEVKTYSIIEVNVEITELKESYLGKLGEVDVSLNKIDEKTLGLFIPYIENGKHILEFDLGTTELNVTQTILEQTKEKVIESFNSMASSSETNNFNNIISNASEDEKQAIAIFLEANREIFTDILNIDFENDELNQNSNERFSKTSGTFSSLVQLKNPFVVLTTETTKFRTNLAKVVIGVTAIALGKEIVVGGVATGGLVSVGGALIGGAGVALIYNTFPQLKKNVLDILDIPFNTESFDINGDNEFQSRQRISKVQNIQNNTISFKDNESKNFSFTQNNKTLENSDRSNQNSVLQLFFTTHDLFNKTIDKINNVIDIANEIPFVNIEKINSSSIPTNSVTENIEVNSEFFSNYTFSISDNRITLNKRLLESGKVELTLNVEESLNLPEPLESKLNITYNDGFKEILTSYDITLEKYNNPFIGNWTAVSFNGGNSMGELQKSNFIAECNVYTDQWTINSASANINESNISINISQRTGGSGYTSTNGVVDCESIIIEFENDNFLINDNYTIISDDIAELDTQIEFGEGESTPVLTSPTLKVNGSRLVFNYGSLILTFEK